VRYPNDELSDISRSVVPWREITPQAARLLTHFSLERYGRLTGTEALRVASKDRVFTVFNGPVNGAALQRKDLFWSTISGLGYLAPRTTIVERGDDLDAALEAVTRLDDASQRRFCKPVDGQRGLGAMLVESPPEAIAFVGRALGRHHPRYLVQKAHVAVQEWRYIAHRDVVGILAGEPHRWGIRYEKVRPVVTGDGRSSVQSLVNGHPGMPERSRRLYFKSHAEEKFKAVPEAGQEVTIAETANVRLGTYVRYPDSRESQYLDTFMTRFLADLERHLFQPYGYGTLCFDLGIMDPDLLHRPYKHAEASRAIVFYEHQLTFGMNVFLKDRPVSGNLPPWGKAPDYWKRDILPFRRDFYRSMLASGIVLGDLASGRRTLPGQCA
jgi:hypothetical protein